MSPPTSTSSMPRVEQISAESDLSTRTQQMRFLVAELGVTRQQAHRLIVAYEKDLRDAVLEADREQRFFDWLMRQSPGGRRRTVCKREWAVRS